MTGEVHKEFQGKSFEQLLRMLDDAVTALEQDSLSLEESIEAYERSVRIVAACNTLLDSAEMRLSRIDEHYMHKSGTEDDGDESDT
ncbi:MAG: exodeoxyribonuclease VII small subunit [Chloroflexota bacterium]